MIKKTSGYVAYGYMQVGRVAERMAEIFIFYREDGPAECWDNQHRVRHNTRWILENYEYFGISTREDETK